VTNFTVPLKQGGRAGGLPHLISRRCINVGKRVYDRTRDNMFQMAYQLIDHCFHIQCLYVTDHSVTE